MTIYRLDILLLNLKLVCTPFFLFLDSPYKFYKVSVGKRREEWRGAKSSLEPPTCRQGFHQKKKDRKRKRPKGVGAIVGTSSGLSSAETKKKPQKASHFSMWPWNNQWFCSLVYIAESVSYNIAKQICLIVKFEVCKLADKTTSLADMLIKYYKFKYFLL